GNPYPTLGPQICEFLEDTFVYGPGTLKGQPYKVRGDLRYIIYRAYEHYPEGHIIDYGEGETSDMTGRRRFQFVNISLPKGSAKTEIEAFISHVELHPDAPVRFNGYDPNAEGGLAPGRAVLSPFIPMLAPTKKQLDDLAYGAAYAIAKDIDPDGQIFDIKLEMSMLVGDSESKILPVAASDSSLDGGKTTFQAIDESHHLHEDRHLIAYRTMVNNLPKRRQDDPWQMTCTTAGDPTEPSVAREQYKTGVQMAEGLIEEPNTFFYHRGTSDENAVFDTMGQRIRALKEASGEEVAKIRDLRSVAQMWDNEENDKSYLERVWCNRW